MLELSGTLIRKPRAQIKSPNDGVHTAGKDGWIKGCHCMMLKDEPLFHGQVGFVYKLSEDKCVKVFIYVKTGHKREKKYVETVRLRMHKYWKKGISPRPGKISKVYVDFKYKDKHYKKECWGLEMYHCSSTDAWLPYAHGNPYDWNSDDHPDHSAEGFIRFAKKIDKTLSHEDKKILDKVGRSLKLGDTLWDTKTKRWYFCDVG